MFGFFRKGDDRPAMRRDWHPATNEALALLSESNWASLSDLVRAETPNGAFSLLRAIGEHGPLDQSFAALPEKPVESAVFGALHVGWAWRHRGFGRGHEVDEDVWDPFFSALDIAEKALIDAVRHDEDDGVALAFLIRAATGSNSVQLLSEARDRFYQVPRRPLEGASWLLQGFGRKWHGDHEKMFDIAERLAIDDDQHPARVGLRARRLIELWLWDGHMADDPATNMRGQALFALSETKAEIEKISSDYERLMSVWSVEEADPYAAAFAHNNIGFAAYLAKLWDVAGRHVTQIGDAPSEWPWCYEIGGGFDREWLRVERRIRRHGGFSSTDD